MISIAERYKLEVTDKAKGAHFNEEYVFTNSDFWGSMCLDGNIALSFGD